MAREVPPQRPADRTDLANAQATTGLLGVLNIDKRGQPCPLDLAQGRGQGLDHEPVAPDGSNDRKRDAADVAFNPARFGDNAVGAAVDRELARQHLERCGRKHRIDNIVIPGPPDETGSYNVGGLAHDRFRIGEVPHQNPIWPDQTDFGPGAEADQQLRSEHVFVGHDRAHDDRDELVHRRRGFVRSHRRAGRSGICRCQG